MILFDCAPIYLAVGSETDSHPEGSPPPKGPPFGGVHSGRPSRPLCAASPGNTSENTQEQCPCIFFCAITESVYGSVDHLQMTPQNSRFFKKFRATRCGMRVPIDQTVSRDSDKPTKKRRYLCSRTRENNSLNRPRQGKKKI